MSAFEHLKVTDQRVLPPGAYRQVVVKVIDPRGNELLVVRKLGEAK